MLYFSKHHLIWKSLIALIPCLMYTDDCEWSAWEYGKCSASCGTGTQEIRRSYRSIHGERCGVADQVKARPCKNPNCSGISPLMISGSFQNWLSKWIVVNQNCILFLMLVIYSKLWMESMDSWYMLQNMWKGSKNKLQNKNHAWKGWRKMHRRNNETARL